MYLLTSIPFKSRYIHIAMFLLLATIGSVCQQGALVEELCCGYSYVDDGGNSNRIVYKIYNNSGIHGHVVQYVHNSAFILVLQQPKYEEHLIDLAYKVRTEDPGLQQNPDNSIDLSKEIADSLLRHDSIYKKIFAKKYNLWIVSEKGLFGPLDFNEYYQKRIELGIPEGLYLKL